MQIYSITQLLSDAGFAAPVMPPIREGERPEDAEIPPGWYAISVNFVRGLPSASWNGDGTKTFYGLKNFARFQYLEPVAMAGYSIYIYHVPEPIADSKG